MGAALLLYFKEHASSLRRQLDHSLKCCDAFCT
jgi:hypothetical protein